MGEFEAVSEGSAGGKNGISQAQGADGYAQVNVGRGTAARGGVCGAHFAEKDNTNFKNRLRSAPFQAGRRSVLRLILSALPAAIRIGSRLRLARGRRARPALFRRAKPASARCRQA